MDTTARKVFGAYERFLWLLNDDSQRQRLDGKLVDEGVEAAAEEVRQIGHEFRDGLEELFFSSNAHLTKLVKRYGVF